MKEWNKPFMKVVVLEECDMIATSGEDVPTGNVQPSTNTNSVIWEDKTGDKF